MKCYYKNNQDGSIDVTYDMSKFNKDGYVNEIDSEDVVVGPDNKIHIKGTEPAETTEQYNERMRQLRAEAYALSVDNLMSEYTRKDTFDEFTEGEQVELSSKIKDIVEWIQQEYQYVSVSPV